MSADQDTPQTTELDAPVNEASSGGSCVPWEELLEKAHELLSNCADYESTVTEIARLSAVACDGWCSVDLVESDGSVVRSAVVHKDPAKAEAAERVRLKYPASPTAARGVYAVIRTGQSFMLTDYTTESWRAAWEARDSEAYQTLCELGCKSYMALPLTTRGQNVGAVMLVSASRQFTQQDLELARKLAQRFAVAVDLAKMFRRMREAIQLRDDFISIAAHELRTPLTPLSLQSDFILHLLEGEPLSPQSRERIEGFLSISARQTQRLIGLVNELLDVSKINNNSFNLNVSEVDLVDLVRQVVATFEESLRSAGCTVQIHETERVIGKWDSMRIEQVVYNLISNAIKFGAGHPIEISVRALPQGGQLSIRDHGTGIASADHKRVFERYERAFQPDTVKALAQGLGLGLFIAKQIVQLHGGTIEVQSELGQGATFIVRLP